MGYQRYKLENNLTKTQKKKLLSEYIVFYRGFIEEHGLDVLNVKIPREVFASILDDIGALLNEHAIRLSSEEGEVKKFLEANPLPSNMEKLIPDEFRTFSLLLNALKQWVSTESAATDKYLLGGKARQICQEAVDRCLVTGDELGENAELHHPLRDGRPPILLSKVGHDLIEQNYQKNDNEFINECDVVWNKVKQIRNQQNQSWIQLREGSNAIISKASTARPNAKSFANKVIREVGISAEEIIEMLDVRGL
ncbi:hypothetical protein [Paenibacillus amylolyticus]|uniref:hypothetical protein n=1 Tax=Paenibacillus amylolyticus TaxID=1451 RepID=UPI0039B0CF5A